MNGSRLNEHRKKRVPFVNWMVLVGIIAAILALSPALSKGAEPLTMEFNGDTGLIVMEARTCVADTLDSDSIGMLDGWVYLTTKMDLWQRGGTTPLTSVEIAMGEMLARDTCVVLAEFYPIVVVEEMRGYLLFRYDEQLGFTEGTMIMRRRDFRPDRGL